MLVKVRSNKTVKYSNVNAVWSCLLGCQSTLAQEPCSSRLGGTVTVIQNCVEVFILNRYRQKHRFLLGSLLIYQYLYRSQSLYVVYLGIGQGEHAITLITSQAKKQCYLITGTIANEKVSGDKDFMVIESKVQKKLDGDGGTVWCKLYQFNFPLFGNKWGVTIFPTPLYTQPLLSINNILLWED